MSTSVRVLTRHRSHRIGVRRALLLLLLRARAILVLVLLLILFSALAPEFLTANNLSILTKHVAITALLAVGMTFVVLTGGIDLSVGSIAGLGRHGGRISADAGHCGSAARPTIRRLRSWSCSRSAPALWWAC